MADSFKNFIAGEWVAPTTGAYFENRNPADWNEVIGCFPRSGPDDVARAVAAAQRGFAQWSKTPAPIRGDVLHRVGDLLVQRKDEIAHAMTREMGKVLAETRGDVQEGIDTAYYAHTEGRRLFGRTVPSELRAKWSMRYRRTFGTTGQRCTATSRLILHEKVHDTFLQRLCDRADKLRLGPGLDETTEVGPLINEDARKKVEYYVGVGEEAGARRLIGGARPSDKRLERGWFYRPTVLAGVRPG